MLFRVCLFTLLATVPAAAAPSVADAVALVNAKRFPEAREMLERIVTAEPRNSAAWYQLGMILEKKSGEDSTQKAVDCLEKAVAIEPNNADYLAEYGGQMLELADRTRSLSAAFKGRDAMEKAVQLNPDDLDAREGLFQYYTQAPFFAGGSSGKAAAELEEIRRRDPARAMTLSVVMKANAKDFEAAFAICDSALKKNADDYAALYQYGRTASISGEHLARGIQYLRHALTIEPPGPASPTHSNAWYRIGAIYNRLGKPADARGAFETALQLDPTNRLAKTALDKLPKP